MKLLLFQGHLPFLDYETELWPQWTSGVRRMEIRSQGPTVESIIGEAHITVKYNGLPQRSVHPLPPLSESYETVVLAQHRSEQEEKESHPDPKRL